MYDLIIFFSGYAVGSVITVLSLAFLYNNQKHINDEKYK